MQVSRNNPIAHIVCMLHPGDLTTMSLPMALLAMAPRTTGLTSAAPEIKRLCLHNTVLARLSMCHQDGGENDALE